MCPVAFIDIGLDPMISTFMHQSDMTSLFSLFTTMRINIF